MARFGVGAQQGPGGSPRLGPNIKQERVLMNTNTTILHWGDFNLALRKRWRRMFDGEEPKTARFVAADARKVWWANA